jgi:hypothetical protein
MKKAGSKGETEASSGDDAKGASICKEAKVHESSHMILMVSSGLARYGRTSSGLLPM